MNINQIQPSTIIFLNFLIVCYASVTVTVERRNQDGDIFSSTEGCSKFSAQDDTVPNSCVCKQAGQVEGGTYQAKTIGGKLQQNCEYDLKASEGCEVTIVSKNIPYFMKSQNDLFQNNFLSNDFGESTVTMSVCSRFFIQSTDVWKGGKWEFFASDEFVISDDGFQYLLGWLDRNTITQVWKKEYQGQLFRIKTQCNSNIVSNGCMLVKIQGSRDYLVDGGSLPSSSSTTPSTTPSTTISPTPATSTSVPATSSVAPVTQKTTTTSPSEAPIGDEDDNNAGTGIGIFFGILILIILILIILACLHKKSKVDLTPAVRRIPISKVRVYLEDRDCSDGNKIPARSPTAVPNEYQPEITVVSQNSNLKKKESFYEVSKEDEAKSSLEEQEEFAAKQRRISTASQIPKNNDTSEEKARKVSLSSIGKMLIPKRKKNSSTVFENPAAIYEELPESMTIPPLLHQPPKSENNPPPPPPLPAGRTLSVPGSNFGDDDEDLYAIPEKSPGLPHKHLTLQPNMTDGHYRTPTGTLKKDSIKKTVSLASLDGWDDDEFDDSDTDDEVDGGDNQLKKDEYLTAEDTDNYLDNRELDRNLKLSQKQKQLNKSNQMINLDAAQEKNDMKNYPSSTEGENGEEEKQDLYLDLGDVGNI